MTLSSSGGCAEIGLGQVPVEQAREAHGTRYCVEFLPPRHGPLTQPQEPSGPGVPGDIVRRNRGAGKDEPPGLYSRINGTAHEVLQFRGDLPLVEQPGCLAVEE